MKNYDLLKLTTALVLGFLVFVFQSQLGNDVDFNISSLSQKQAVSGLELDVELNDFGQNVIASVSVSDGMSKRILERYFYSLTGDSKDPVERFNTCFLGHSPT